MVEWEFPEKLGFLFSPAPFKVIRGGRGGGKSWGVARALLLLGAEKRLRILCMRQVQKSIKDSVYELLKQQITALGLDSCYECLATEIRGANGTVILFSGLSDHTATSIKSFEGIDICWVEEAQAVTRYSWDILLPTIRKDGSEVWVTLNPEMDTDETWVRFVESPPKGAVVVEMNYNDNPFLPQRSKDERENMLSLVESGKRDRDDYENIWEGKTKAALPGSIYHKEVTQAKLAGRLRSVPYDPLLKVHCIWDLGWADLMSILCVQRAASEVRVIRYIEGNHRTYDDFVRELNSYGYNFGQDWLPHDGARATAESGRSPQKILKALGRNCPDDESTIVPEIGVENGIKAARLMFPRVYFDKDNAGGLFTRLGKYKRSINAQTQSAGKPQHNDDSHGADGFRYLSVIEPKLTNEDAYIPSDPFKYFRRAG